MDNCRSWWRVSLWTKDSANMVLPILFKKKNREKGVLNSIRTIYLGFVQRIKWRFCFVERGRSNGKLPSRGAGLDACLRRRAATKCDYIYESLGFSNIPVNIPVVQGFEFKLYTLPQTAEVTHPVNLNLRPSPITPCRFKEYFFPSESTCLTHWAIAFTGRIGQKV